MDHQNINRNHSICKRLSWRIILSTFFFIPFPEFSAFASGPDTLKNLESIQALINQAQENGNYKVSLHLCRDLLSQAARYDKKSAGKFIQNAHLFMAEAYRELDQDSLFERKINEIYNQQANPSDNVMSFDMAAYLYGYYIYKADLLFKKKKSREAAVALNSAITFILKHPEFYSDRFVKDSMDCLDFRLYQCFRRFGEMAMERNDFIDAGIQFNQALKKARGADRVIDRYNLGSQGCEEKILLNLIKLGLRSGNERMLGFYQEEYNRLPKAPAYGQNKERDFLNTLLGSKELTVQDGLRMISRVQKNKLTANDISIQLQIVEFYLRNGMIRQSELAFSSLESKAIHAADLSAINLSRAGIANARGDFQAMSDAMDSSLHHLTSNTSMVRIWGDLGLRTQMMETVTKAIQYHDRGFAECRDPVFLEKKLEFLEHFLNGLRSIRKDIIADEDRLGFIQRLAPILDLALEAYTDSLNPKVPDFESILTCFEAVKAFNLQSEYGLRQRLNDPDLNKFRNLISELNEVKFHLEHNEGDYDSLRERYNSLQIQLSDLKLLYPSLAENSKTITNIQSSLDAETTLVNYYKGHQYIYAFLINKDQCRLTRLPGAAEEISRSVSEFRLSISMASENRFSSLRDSLYRKAGWKLYHVLLETLAPFIHNRLIIIPDLELSHLPFAALLTVPVNHSDYKSWPFLIHDYLISSQYSLALWMEQAKPEGAAKRKKPESEAFISFAPAFEDLLYNRAECESISGLLGNATGFYGSKANRRNFDQFAGYGRILHIASHARSNEDDTQEESYICLHEDTLKAETIRSMHLPQSLVFLSACETGTGKIVSGEGVMSLARSFFQAGSRSVISTLWPIRDDLSKDQVVKVYKNLRAGQPKDEAIRNMQIDYISKSGFGQAFPAFWAAYQSQGDQGPLFLNHMISLGYLLGLAPIFALGLAFLFYKKYFGVRQ